MADIKLGLKVLELSREEEVESKRRYQRYLCRSWNQLLKSLRRIK